MLQIASGKFFSGRDRHIHSCKGILYSNYSWIGPIETVAGTLEPVGPYSSSVTGYVLNYINQIERTDGPGGIVQVGDSEIVEQFRLLSMFGLQAHFGHDRREVEENCRSRPSRPSDSFLPSQFVPRFFTPAIHGSLDEVERFQSFLRKAIGLPRKVYQSLISCLSNLDHALEVLNYNVDLAYSMLVYCLESLCQSFGEQPDAAWEDYDEKTRSSLDIELAKIDPNAAKVLRDILLREAHLKLQAKFLEFVIGHTSPTYYTTEATGVERPVRRSELRQALKNAYLFRSLYAHKLQQMLHQLRVPTIAKSEIFTWENQPYLTFRGLLRLVLHVFRNFIESQPSMDTEEYNWRGDLPGVIRLKAAPQYWIWQADALGQPMTKQFREEAVRSRFNGFLEHLQEAIITKGALTDLRSLLEKYEEIFPQSPANDRLRMLVPYILYNRIITPDGRSTNCDEFINKHSSILDNCSIDSMIVHLILTEDFPWQYSEAREVYDAYAKQRFSPKAIRLPFLFEMKLVLALANKALAQGEVGSYRTLLDAAISEAAGNTSLQDMVIAAMKDEVAAPHRQVFTILSDPTPQQPGMEPEPTAVAAEDAPSGSEVESVPPQAPEVLSKDSFND
ncbi:MAG: hypothetical protein JWM10_3194 [Myxococcaceae bacterium]|nr:hypothetical protein [Myxococcaceae bacterium]